MNRLISLGVLAVAFVLPAAAQADPGNGAEVSRVRQCDTFNFGTLCVDDHVVTNLTSTPSGNSILVGHTDYAHSLVGANGTCSFEDSGKVNSHTLVGPHVLEISEVFRVKYPILCTDGNVIVCTAVIQVHIVNGVVQFFRSIFECTEEPAP